LEILQVHNYYQQAGGEDKVVQNEKELLEKYGHSVWQFMKHNDCINNFQKKLEVFLTTHYSHKTKREFEQFLKKNRPDIVHVHNFFPLITPSIFDVCSSQKIPVVLTLHNYRIVDPGSLLLHNGKVDERSLTGSAYDCVWDGVYRGSVLQTAVVAHMIEYHRKRKTWDTKVNRLIALSDFAKSKFIEGGIAENQLTIKPNFVNDYSNEISDSLPVSHIPSDYYVFVGRISSEKGIEMLVETWVEAKIPTPLYIIGEGPLMDKLKQKAHENNKVVWLGFQPKETTLQYIRKAKAMVFPSICYENFPMTILEAFCLGKPVIVSDRGSHAGIVKDQVTGIHFKVGNKEDLADKMMGIEQHPGILSHLEHNARKEYLEKYTPEKNYEILMNIYQNSIKQ